jgi:hypothetical protein
MSVLYVIKCLAAVGLFYLVLAYGLFNDAFSNSEYITSNYRMIDEKLIGKDVEGSGYALI